MFWFRFLVVFNTTIMFITWFVNINPSLEFDLSTPLMFSANVVSWIDLTVSIIGDIYLAVSDYSK